MKTNKIQEQLFSLQDAQYAAFTARIIPTVDRDSIIGIRTPALRAFAKELVSKEDKAAAPEEFLNGLPHKYFEENQLHAFVISLEKDFDKCVSHVEKFLPYIDNWATCDQLSPKSFKKEKEKLLPYIKKWIKSEKTYTVRFAIGMLMQHFLDENFCDQYASMVAKVKSDEYYVNMMRAWYFATALAKQYNIVLPYIQQKKLDAWTHNKAIQKSIESYRITEEEKNYLRTLKVSL